MSVSEGLLVSDLLTDSSESVFSYGYRNSTSTDLSLNATYSLTTGTHAPVNHNHGSIVLDTSAQVRISLFSLIFFLAVIGNGLVILTLVQNRRMRTVTNVFLINLSLSDLILAVVCMPFTLIPTLLRNFIFGKAMCVLIRYLQGVSVAVSAFTLVSISLERYFAICQPLRSRSWQTLSHSYKMIVCVWLLSFIVMLPTAVMHQLLYIRGGRHKCEEQWPSESMKLVYTLFLDAVLLVLPLLLMLVAYGMIAGTLCQGIRLEERSVKEVRELRNVNSQVEEDVDSEDETRYGNGVSINGNRRASASVRKRQEVTSQPMRQSNAERSLQAKRRVIRMLFIVVMEFFICWTPVYVLNTWVILDRKSAVEHVNPMTMNMVHLLSYASSCCNPITYCFLNKRFRQGFLSAFDCCGFRRRRNPWQNQSTFGGASQKTGNLLKANYKSTDKTSKSAVRINSPLIMIKKDGYQNNSVKLELKPCMVCEHNGKDV